MRHFNLSGGTKDLTGKVLLTREFPLPSPPESRTQSTPVTLTHTPRTTKKRRMRCRAGTPIFKKNWVRFCCISNTQRHWFLSTPDPGRQTTTKKIVVERRQVGKADSEEKHTTLSVFTFYYTS